MSYHRAVKTSWIVSLVVALVGATLLSAGCARNYRSEYKGNSPVRIRNLSTKAVQSVTLVPETEHDKSPNWLAAPISAGGEITFTLKDGGYWFQATGSGVDTGTSGNSRFGRLVVINGATEIVLFDATSPVSDTQTKGNRSRSGSTPARSLRPRPGPSLRIRRPRLRLRLRARARARHRRADQSVRRSGFGSIQSRRLSVST